MTLSIQHDTDSSEDIVGIKKVKSILAAGALTGIILATMLGLGFRSLTRAAAVQSPPAAAQLAQTNTGLAAPGSQSGSFFVEEEHEGWEFDGD
jgi:hypothetical protein